MENVLEVKNLTKQFGKFTAVDNISFSLKEGEILGFLGINGAGKTTTIQMLLGILTPTNGDVAYFGKKLTTHREEILEKVNFSSTYTNLPWRLSVKENLTFISYFYTIPDRKKRVEKILETFRLTEMQNKSMSSLSAGQLTRVNIAKSFINYPKVLLLDEPTASLDPEVAKYIREFILEQREKFQISIIITSHNMAEVEQICDRVIFIDKGKIIANDTPENLSKTITISHLELLVKDKLEKLKDLCKENKFTFTQSKKHISINMHEKQIPEFLQEMSKQHIEYEEISIEKPTLEDYFLQMTENK